MVHFTANMAVLSGTLYVLPRAIAGQVKGKYFWPNLGP